MGICSKTGSHFNLRERTHPPLRETTFEEQQKKLKMSVHRSYVVTKKGQPPPPVFQNRGVRDGNKVPCAWSVSGQNQSVGFLLFWCEGGEKGRVGSPLRPILSFLWHKKKKKEGTKVGSSFKKINGAEFSTAHPVVF